MAVPPQDLLPFAIGGFEAIGRRTPPSFYEIAFVTASPPMLRFAMPGQAQSWRCANGIEGKVILFTNAFLEAYPRDREMLRMLGSTRSLTLSKKDKIAFEAVTREMEEEYRLRAPGSTAILQACLHILLLRASRLRRVRGGLLRR
jgi:hypothetical protein